jgi:hypothetical protein
MFGGLLGRRGRAHRGVRGRHSLKSPELGQHRGFWGTTQSMYMCHAFECVIARARKSTPYDENCRGVSIVVIVSIRNALESSSPSLPSQPQIQTKVTGMYTSTKICPPNIPGANSTPSPICALITTRTSPPAHVIRADPFAVARKSVCSERGRNAVRARKSARRGGVAVSEECRYDSSGGDSRIFGEKDFAAEKFGIVKVNYLTDEKFCFGLGSFYGARASRSSPLIASSTTVPHNVLPRHNVHTPSHPPHMTYQLPSHPFRSLRALLFVGADLGEMRGHGIPSRRRRPCRRAARQAS